MDMKNENLVPQSLPGAACLFCQRIQRRPHQDFPI